MSTLGGCRKKHKSLEPRRHEGTKEAFFCLPSVAQANPEQNFVSSCLCGSFLFRAFYDNLRNGGKSLLATSPEEVCWNTVGQGRTISGECMRDQASL